MNICNQNMKMCAHFSGGLCLATHNCGMKTPITGRKGKIYLSNEKPTGDCANCPYRRGRNSSWRGEKLETGGKCIYHKGICWRTG